MAQIRSVFPIVPISIADPYVCFSRHIMSSVIRVSMPNVGLKGPRWLVDKRFRYQVSRSWRRGKVQPQPTWKEVLRKKVSLLTVSSPHQEALGPWGCSSCSWLAIRRSSYSQRWKSSIQAWWGIPQRHRRIGRCQMDSGPASYHPENKVRKECTVPIIFIAISTRRHLDVGHPNLYFIQLVQNVSLSETQGCVSIQLTREPFQT